MIKNLHKDGNEVNVFMTTDDKLNNKLKLHGIQTYIKNLIQEKFHSHTSGF